MTPIYDPKDIMRSLGGDFCGIDTDSSLCVKIMNSEKDICEMDGFYAWTMAENYPGLCAILQKVAECKEWTEESKGMFERMNLSSVGDGLSASVLCSTLGLTNRSYALVETSSSPSPSSLSFSQADGGGSGRVVPRPGRDTRGTSMRSSFRGC